MTNMVFTRDFFLIASAQMFRISYPSSSPNLATLKEGFSAGRKADKVFKREFDLADGCQNLTLSSRKSKERGWVRNCTNCILC